MKEIVVTKGTSEFLISRDELSAVDEAPDGIVFHLKTNMFLHFTDQWMPQDVKQKIIVSVNTFGKGTVYINLNDYKNVVRLEA